MYAISPPFDSRRGTCFTPSSLRRHAVIAKCGCGGHGEQRDRDRRSEHAPTPMTRSGARVHGGLLDGMILACVLSKIPSHRAHALLGSCNPHRCVCVVVATVRHDSTR